MQGAELTGPAWRALRCGECLGGVIVEVAVRGFAAFEGGKGQFRKPTEKFAGSARSLRKKVSRPGARFAEFGGCGRFERPEALRGF